jgi:hypothetical protein
MAPSGRKKRFDATHILVHDQSTDSVPVGVARRDVTGWPEVDELVRRLADEAGVARDDAREAVLEGRRVRPSLRWLLRRHRVRPVNGRREVLLITFWLVLLLVCIGATVFVSYLTRG